MAVRNSAGRSGVRGRALAVGVGRWKVTCREVRGTYSPQRSCAAALRRPARDRAGHRGRGLVTADQAAEPPAPHPCGRRPGLDYLATKHERRVEVGTLKQHQSCEHSQRG